MSEEIRTVVVIGGEGNIGREVVKQVEEHGWDADSVGHGDGYNAVDSADVAMLATKPQSFASYADELKTHVDEHLVIGSVMAGKTTHEIAEKLGTTKIFRTMPNLAIRNQQSLTGLFIRQGTLNEDEIAAAEEIVGQWGMTMRLEDEEQFDAFTGLVGSALEYFLELAVHLQDAAIEQGFTGDQARLIGEQVLRGAASLVGQGQTAAELVERITSKGGTTAAAREVFRRQGFKRMVSMAVQAATNRSRELGQSQQQRKHFWQR